MKLKLKENPREWQKFVSVLLLLPIIVSVLLWRRGVVSVAVLGTVAALASLICLACWIWPRPFRPVYRVGMTVSFHVGQTMGMVLLTVFFLLVVTPFGLILRLFGKDLLRMKRGTGESYWVKSTTRSQFDRQF